jgi:hypothetical protein
VYTLSDTEFTVILVMALHCMPPHLVLSHLYELHLNGCMLLILLLAFNMTHVISLSVFMAHHSIFSFRLPFFLSSILPLI